MMLTPLRVSVVLVILGCASGARAELPGYLEQAFEKTRWVAYSPTGGSPNLGTAEARDADHKREEVKKDLAVLRKAGFGGIVTYGCDGLKGEIPALARAVGIEHVIMGVYDPRNAEEIKNAKAAARLVDAYCVGNEGLGHEGRYTLDELTTCMNDLRRWSGRPVTTSEQLEDYSGDGAVLGLIEAGDWLFPNVHPWFHGKYVAAEASRWTQEQVESLRAKGKGKVVLCKEVGFPTAGDEENRASEELQSDYYLALAALDVPFVYFEAFDQEWKRHLPIEPHWGLFTKEREPKKVIAMIGRDAGRSKVRFVGLESGGKLGCTVSPDGGFFTVTGTTTGLGANQTLLLFVKPHDPGTSGWFLQFNPNGVDINLFDGTWSARGQVGNATDKPETGDIISLMIRAVDLADANAMIEKRKRDPALSNTGIPSQELPKAESEWSAELKDLELEVP